jgi:hypothetical protein
MSIQMPAETGAMCEIIQKANRQEDKTIRVCNMQFLILMINLQLDMIDLPPFRGVPLGRFARALRSLKQSGARVIFE